MSKNTAVPTAQSGKPHNLGLILAALMLTLLLAALDQTIVATALPTITSELGGLNELTWVVTAYLLAATASTPLWGKLSDIHGRKLLLQTAIVVFVLGSVLAGASQSMGQLITTRAIQGVGGGGLMVLVMAVIADLIPPRERGRYSGMFGGVFGLASVVGPFIGGFFTQSLSWRWIFYINVPLGIAAFLILGAVLHLPQHAGHTRIDWLGALLLVPGVTSLLLVIEWGGHQYPWLSWQIALLALISLALIASFVLVEIRAVNPLVSMKLFANKTIRISFSIGFLVGFAMMGSIVYLSIYMQLVRGATPTQAGLQLLPLMMGMLLTSVASGQVISRTGKYRIFPIAGTVAAALGLFLLSTLTPQSPYWLAAAFMLILGAGLGCMMQVLVLIVQNTASRSDIGAATSASTFFRSIGASFGTAFFGAVYAARLASEMPGGAGSTASQATSSMSKITQLPEALQRQVVEAFSHAMSTTFLVAVPFMVAAFILALVLPEVHLNTSHEPGQELGEDAPLPLVME